MRVTYQAYNYMYVHRIYHVLHRIYHVLHRIYHVFDDKRKGMKCLLLRPSTFTLHLLIDVCYFTRYIYRCLLLSTFTY